MTNGRTAVRPAYVLYTGNVKLVVDVCMHVPLLVGNVPLLVGAVPLLLAGVVALLVGDISFLRPAM